jgi:hypothetical protein
MKPAAKRGSLARMRREMEGRAVVRLKETGGLGLVPRVGMRRDLYVELQPARVLNSGSRVTHVWWPYRGVEQQATYRS